MRPVTFSVTGRIRALREFLTRLCTRFYTRLYA
jgi:hypothetical protein